MVFPTDIVYIADLPCIPSIKSYITSKLYNSLWLYLVYSYINLKFYLVNSDTFCIDDHVRWRVLYVVTSCNSYNSLDVLFSLVKGIEHCKESVVCVEWGRRLLSNKHRHMLSKKTPAGHQTPEKQSEYC